MAELEFSRSDVEGLARKLVDARLSGRERALLLAIFRVAADQVSTPLPLDSVDPDELHEQLIDSFLPDSGEEFMIHRKSIR